VVDQIDGRRRIGYNELHVSQPESAPMNDVAVRCLGLTKAYGEISVVRDLSFEVKAGTILALLGPSGCGKTTTLRLIAGFERPDAGVIEIGGRVVSDSQQHVPPERRHAGMVFQDYAIFPHLSVAQNIAFGLGRGAEARAQTAAMLDLVGLSGTAGQMPHELSGGQQQRIALARAMAPRPAVLLLDEPFSNLDTGLRVQVRAEVRSVLKARGATAIFVTHDQEEALFIGDQVAVMNQGRLEQIGSPQDIFHRPATRFVAEFIGQTDFLPGIVVADGIETPVGLIRQPIEAAVGAAVDLAVRPDDVALEEAADRPNARVIERRFIGIANIYAVELADGQRLHSWQPHGCHLTNGSPVTVSLRPGHALPYFEDSRESHLRQEGRGVPGSTGQKNGRQGPDS
jgi:iron(III) transport system ATP-binding protein